MTEPAGTAEPADDDTAIVDRRIASGELPDEPSPGDREMQDAAEAATELDVD